MGFRSLTEPIDTTTAGGRLNFSIFGALADFERQLIRYRTMAGLEAARALLARPGATVTSVAEDLGVSRATLYRTVLTEGSTAPPPRPAETSS